jgi:hypothetical protein
VSGSAPWPGRLCRRAKVCHDDDGNRVKSAQDDFRQASRKPRNILPEPAVIARQLWDASGVGLLTCRLLGCQVAQDDAEEHP